jgi:cyclase
MTVRRGLRAGVRLGTGLTACVLQALLAGGAAAQGAPARAATAPIEILKIQGNVYLLAGPSGNTVVQVGEQGVLVVDTQGPGLSGQLLAAVRTLSNEPIHYIVNTQADPDHTGGNETLARLGPSRPGRVALADGVGGNNTGSTSVIAHEQVLNRMSGQTRGEQARPEGGWPTDTFFGESTEVFFNGEGVQVMHQPAAHTDGDSLVFFRRSDVIAAGDLFLTTGYPVIDRARGGSVNGLIAALNHIITLAIPTHNNEGGTMIVPGHGRLCDEMDVVEYRNMVTIVRDRIQHLIAKGLTLEQVEAAGPTADFDPRYGAGSPGWTPAMFIEAIYRDLAAAKGKVP